MEVEFGIDLNSIFRILKLTINSMNTDKLPNEN